jgi:hypothetical protein
MSIFSIILNEKDPDFEANVHGKALAKYAEPLSRLCRKLEVKPLMSFSSLSDLDEREDEAISGTRTHIKITEKWFDPDEGLRTVTALLEALEDSPRLIEKSEWVVNELQEFKRVLKEASKHHLKWHLGIEY